MMHAGFSGSIFRNFRGNVKEFSGRCKQGSNPHSPALFSQEKITREDHEQNQQTTQTAQPDRVSCKTITRRFNARLLCHAGFSWTDRCFQGPPASRNPCWPVCRSVHNPCVQDQHAPSVRRKLRDQDKEWG